MNLLEIRVFISHAAVNMKRCRGINTILIEIRDYRWSIETIHQTIGYIHIVSGGMMSDNSLVNSLWSMRRISYKVLVLCKP